MFNEINDRMNINKINSYLSILSAGWLRNIFIRVGGRANQTQNYNFLIGRFNFCCSVCICLKKASKFWALWGLGTADNDYGNMRRNFFWHPCAAINIGLDWAALEGSQSAVSCLCLVWILKEVLISIQTSSIEVCSNQLVSKPNSHYNCFSL